MKGEVLTEVERQAGWVAWDSRDIMSSNQNQGQAEGTSQDPVPFIIGKERRLACPCISLTPALSLPLICTLDGDIVLNIIVPNGHGCFRLQAEHPHSSVPCPRKTTVIS